MYYSKAAGVVWGKVGQGKLEPDGSLEKVRIGYLLVTSDDLLLTTCYLRLTTHPREGEDQRCGEEDEQARADSVLR